MPKGIGRTVVKLLVASLLVGLVLRWLGITPRSLIEHFGETIGHVFDTMAHFANWAIDYVLVGAVIVVPIWLAAVLLDRVRGRRGS